MTPRADRRFVFYSWSYWKPHKVNHKKSHCFWDHEPNFGLQGAGANAPQFFLHFLGCWVEEGQIKIEIFSKRSFGWCKGRQKNYKFALYGRQNRRILTPVNDFAPPLLLAELHLCLRHSVGEAPLHTDAFIFHTTRPPVRQLRVH